MSQGGFPSKNPADESGGLGGAMKTILEKFLQNTDDMLPATVISYDRKSNTATVKPLMAVLTTEDKTVPRAQVAKVPVLALGGGNYMLNFPLKPGDTGWIKANDRDISLFMQSMQEAKPNTTRKHSFEDGLFIPDVLRQYEIDGEDFDENAVFQSLDGQIRVSLWPDRVKVTAGDTWLEVNKDNTIIMTASKEIFLDTPLVKIAGIFQSGTKHGGGMSTMDGGLRTTMDQIAEGVSTAHHTHENTMPGPGQSGTPIGGV